MKPKSNLSGVDPVKAMVVPSTNCQGMALGLLSHLRD
jgi:hypothetical protein